MNTHIKWGLNCKFQPIGKQKNKEVQLQAIGENNFLLMGIYHA